MLPGGVAGLSRHSSLLTTREVCFPRQVSTEKAPGRPGACGRNLSPGQEATTALPVGSSHPTGRGSKSDELGVLKWVLYTPGDGQKPSGDSAESLAQACSSSGQSRPYSL